MSPVFHESIKGFSMRDIKAVVENEETIKAYWRNQHRLTAETRVAGYINQTRQILGFCPLDSIVDGMGDNEVSSWRDVRNKLVADYLFNPSMELNNGVLESLKSWKLGPLIMKEEELTVEERVKCCPFCGVKPEYSPAAKCKINPPNGWPHQLVHRCKKMMVPMVMRAAASDDPEEDKNSVDDLVAAWNERYE